MSNGLVPFGPKSLKAPIIVFCWISKAEYARSIAGVFSTWMSLGCEGTLTSMTTTPVVGALRSDGSRMLE